MILVDHRPQLSYVNHPARNGNSPGASGTPAKGNPLVFSVWSGLDKNNQQPQLSRTQAKLWRIIQSILKGQIDSKTESWMVWHRTGNITHTQSRKESRSKKTSKLRVTGLCEGMHLWPVNSPHQRPVTRKTFLFNDVTMRPRWVKWCVHVMSSFLHETRARFIIIFQISNSCRVKAISRNMKRIFSARVIFQPWDGYPCKKNDKEPWALTSLLTVG